MTLAPRFETLRRRTPNNLTVEIGLAVTTLRRVLGPGFSNRRLPVHSALLSKVERLRPAIDSETARRNQRASGSLLLRSLVLESCCHSADSRSAGRYIRPSAMVFRTAPAPIAVGTSPLARR